MKKRVGLSPEEFRALELKWYEKLKSRGFIDIEDSSLVERPLKKWSSLLNRDEQITQPELKDTVSSLPEQVFKQEEKLLNDPYFKRICNSACTHGNSSLDAASVRIIWRMHCDGISNRSVAKEIGTTEQSIRRILKKIKEWMNLL